MAGENYKFKFVAGNLALDFVNTVAYRFHPEKRKDHLLTAEEVRRWANQAHHPYRHDIGCFPITRLVLRRVRIIREQIFTIFHAIAEGKAIPPDPVRQVDDAFRASQTKRCLWTRRHTADWTWRPSATCSDFLLYPVLVAATDLLTSGSIESVRQCADPSCGWLFLDRSNAGKRRWCTMADCGNRNKVRRHYKRKTTRSLH